MTRLRLALPILSLVALACFCQAQPKHDDKRSVDLGNSEAAPARPPRNFALLVGINEYKNLSIDRQLHYADADAKDLQQVLVSRYGFNDTDVKLLLNATKAQIEDALGWYLSKQNMEPEDRLIVFFACHGQTVPKPTTGEMGFLIPSDGKAGPDPSDYEETCISMEHLREMLGYASSKHILILADACFTGGFLSSRAATGDSGFENEPARIVITAGKKGEESAESSELSHGLFSYALLQELNARASQGMFTAHALRDWVAPKVKDLSDDREHPQLAYFDASAEGEFLFVPSGSAAAKIDVTAKLVVTCPVPGARVSVDGSEVGPAPYTGSYDLDKEPSRSVTVKVTADGYKPSYYSAVLNRANTATVDATLEILSYGADYTAGLKADKEKNYEVAMRSMKSAADKGCPAAMTYIGHLYDYGLGAAKDPAQAFAWYQKGAEAGDPKGMRDTGSCYEDGAGIAQDYAKAMEWFQKGAQAGDSDCLAYIGEMYASGFGVPKDSTQAFSWFVKAAEAGDGPGMGDLGRCYESGVGTTEDLAQAAKWLKKGADAGDCFSMTELGSLYLAGNGVDKDPEQGYKLFLQAANLGDPVGMRLVGVCLALGQGITKDEPQGQNWLKRAAKAGDDEASAYLYAEGVGVPKDLAKTFVIFSKAAADGDVNAMRNVANLYLGGLGTTQDYLKAADWYRRAADLGDAMSMTSLGQMYGLGEGVPKDPSQAFEWFVKAAQLGDPAGMGDLGYAYEMGAGTQIDAQQALKWLTKAANALQSSSMNQLGYMYEFGNGVQRDYGQAMEWFRKAADQGDGEGMSNVGYLYYNGLGTPKDYKQAFGWDQKAADAGNQTGMLNMGVCYENGNGAPQDGAKALSWYEKAAALNNAMAMVACGRLYQMGKGIPTDPAKAFAWFEKGAKTGYPLAMRLFALCYKDGYGTTPPDAQMASEWMIKASLAFDNDATGHTYEEGWGVPKDQAQAFSWYSTAATSGDPIAMFDVGTCYERGIGTAKNLDEAKANYKKSADLGYPPAIEALKRLRG